MTTSSRKGLRGIQKVGSCQGSRICQNIQCPKLQSEGVCNVNPKEFTPDHGAYICKCCGYYAVQIFCSCRKITEYNSVTKELDVWYEGVHNCIPKPDAMNKRNFFKLLPLHRDLCLMPHEFRNDCVWYFMSIGQLEKVKEVALLLDNRDELEKMRYSQPGGKTMHYCSTLTEAFEVLEKIMKELDKIDKYLIWSMNCGKTSDGDTYVFKTSQHHLEMALHMDASYKPLNGKVSILAYEKSYFDGMHRRVRGFKTLTLWLHHPGMRRMKRLASMDVLRENKEQVALFFSTF